MLPFSLRISSLVSIVTYALISTVMLARVGAVTLGVPTDAVEIAIWVVAACFFIAIGLNLGSKSKSERSVMPTVSAVLCVLSTVIALR